jgi:hypothetical protein
MLLLSPSDFNGVGGYDYVSLHDPQIVMLEDGSLRIYVTAKVGEGTITDADQGASSHQLIVSATG